MQTNDEAMNMTADQGRLATGGAGLPALLLPHEGGDAAAGVTGLTGPVDVQVLLAAIRRLEDIVEEETIALRARKKIDFDDFTARKSRSMLEFVRLMRARPDLGAEGEVAEAIRKLRSRLERNREVLEMHYEALREVSEIIVRAIREAESDGTYNAGTAQESK